MISPQSGYAMALLKASNQLGVTAAVCAELPEVDELLTLHSQYFMNPKINAEEKARLLKELLGGKAEDLTVEFVALLALRQKLRSFGEICRQYQKLATEEMGTVVVRLRTPFELSEATLDRLRVYLEKAGLYTLSENGTLEFDITIDKSLLGGFVAETDRHVLDASLKARLTRLARIKE